ncbi:uncharacterized protein LOC118198560 isoform X1 [Stegodyphus dumicola]|uniref:uncharacterized protein LOC118198560 isoform X1 n=2 Tax=Stegodyphus dumicola TaxID=202533 RepID=UPI0015B2117C|nr:uncharacterized protein LOC118198560 isoform X1 [Stegodyphus dumicola]
MWFLFFAYFFAFCSGQSDSDMCDESPYIKCQAVHRGEKPFPVTEEQFAEFCPLIIRYIDCMDKYDKSCDVEIFSVPGQYESIIRLVVDVCDRNTLLHNVFVESLPCYQEVLSNLDKNCFEPRAELHHAVEAHMASELLNITDEANERSEILRQYSLMCL